MDEGLLLDERHGSNTRLTHERKSEHFASCTLGRSNKVDERWRRSHRQCIERFLDRGHERNGCRPTGWLGSAIVIIQDRANARTTVCTICICNSDAT
eukprot:scaffold199875_cov32-Tisochrysis_lutea.AAC.2